MGAVCIYIYMYITPKHAKALGAARIIKMPRASSDAHSGVECPLTRCTQVRLQTLPCCDSACHGDCLRRAMLVYTTQAKSQAAC